MSMDAFGNFDEGNSNEEFILQQPSGAAMGQPMPAPSTEGEQVQFPMAE